MSIRMTMEELSDALESWAKSHGLKIVNVSEEYDGDGRSVLGVEVGVEIIQKAEIK